MLTEVVAGKRYQLIDKEGWLEDYRPNINLLHLFDKNLTIVLDSAHCGIGFLGEEVLIGDDEYKFFQLVD